MTHRREFAACAALVVGSLVVGLVLLELACRLANEAHRLLIAPHRTERAFDWVIHDPLLGFVFKPNATSTEGSFDPDGFRSTSAATPPNAGLVIATGDSFAFGQEVADDQTWPAILQGLIGVRVINAGVSAYGIDQTVLRSELLAAALAPTAMVVSFIADDIWRAEMRRLWGAEKPYFSSGNDGGLVLRNVPVPSAKPDMPDASATASPRRQNRMVLGCASAAGLATLDTFETLNEAVVRDGLHTLFLEQHHNAVGNRLVAQAIGDALTARRILD